MKIHISDNIVVIKGKDRGKTGQVMKVFPDLGLVLVKGLNMAKKHQKPSRKNPRTGIIFKEMPLKVDNVALVCPHCNKKTKVGYSESGNKTEVSVRGPRKIRICKKCQGSLINEGLKANVK